MVNSSMKKILVVKNRALGDSIMGLSTLAWIKENYPESHLIYGLPGWITPLYDNVNIAADEIWEIDLSGIGGWWKLWRRCSSEGVDFVYEMFQSGQVPSFSNSIQNLKTFLMAFTIII